MKSIVTTAMRAGRIAAVALVLLSLLISQAGYACGFFSDGMSESGPSGIRPVFAQMVSIPEDLGESMTPSQGAPLPRAAHLILAPLRHENPDTRVQKVVEGTPLFHSVVVSVDNSTPLTATTCLISSELGRQFTLVGAKPSGTS